MELTDTKALWYAMTEDTLLAHVLEMAETYGWKHYHVFEQKRYARRSSKGFPDLVLVRDGVLLFIELKDQTGETSFEQDGWLVALEAVADAAIGTVHQGVWRPEHWYTGVIQQVLDRSGTIWVDLEDAEL